MEIFFQKYIDDKELDEYKERLHKLREKDLVNRKVGT